jgi:CRP/FNR family cyclic AMP-dependent transcriptional regulator
VLADRWGYVAPDGIHLDLRLTHSTLARLACAQRPSVSTAIGRLGRSGVLRRDAGGFVLPLEFPASVRHELIRPRAD